MHRTLVLGEARQPGLFHGEAEHWREPRRQRGEKAVHDRQRGAARDAVLRIAIERVFSDIQIESREIVDAEIQQRMEHALEVVDDIAVAHERIELGDSRQHVALKLRHVAVTHRETVAVMGEIAEQKAQRVPQAAIRIHIRLDDIGTDAQILRIVRTHGPEAQDFRARLLDHLLRHDDIAERLRHLAAVLVIDEAMGQDFVERGAAARAACFQKRGLEPAAMLVGAFQIERGRPFEVRALLEHEGVGATGIEPHIEDVADLLPGGRVLDESL